MPVQQTLFPSRRPGSCRSPRPQSSPRARLTARLLLTSLTLVTGCAAPQDTAEPAAAPPAFSPNLTTLAEWMTGSFSSAAQAAERPDAYYDIRLEMARIWKDRRDGIWLYVEQAMAGRLDEPYRQRIYRLFEEPPGAFISAVYELPGDPLRFAGAQNDPQRFEGLTPAQLQPREGCSVYLARAGDAFTGATEAGRCASSLGGAAYATSEVTITPDALASWDRGFDIKGVQMWGATDGPYVFDKIAENHE